LPPPVRAVNGFNYAVHLRADELPTGRLIVRIEQHLAAVIDGVLYDTYDCSNGGTRGVYGFFCRETRSEERKDLSDRAKQKFFETVSALIGPRPLRIRLTYAAESLLTLQDKEVPESMLEEFKALRDALTTTPLSDELLKRMPCRC
jgi:hypothetical protein